MFKSKFLSCEQGNWAWPFFDIRVSSYMVMRRMFHNIVLEDKDSV